MPSVLHDEARRHIRAVDKINFTTPVKSDHTVTLESEISKWHRDTQSDNTMWSLPPLRKALSPAQHGTALKSTPLLAVR